MKLFGDLFPGRRTATESLRKDALPDLIPKVNLTMELMIDPGWKLLHEVRHYNSTVIRHESNMPDSLIDLIVGNGGTVNTFRRIELYHEKYNAQQRVSVYVPDNRHWPASLLAMVDVETTMRMRQVMKDAFGAVPEVAPLIDKCTSPDDFRKMLRRCLRIATNMPHINLKG